MALLLMTQIQYFSNYCGCNVWYSPVIVLYRQTFFDQYIYAVYIYMAYKIPLIVVCIYVSPQQGFPQKNEKAS